MSDVCEPRGQVDPPLKKRRIEFVAATQDSTQYTSSISAGELYLSLVLKSRTPSKDVGTTDTATYDTPSGCSTVMQLNSEDALCETCNLPLKVSDNAIRATKRPHEASIAHMVCLDHSHPPSNLDRNRLGLKCLSSYGWDPDSRLGLGVCGEGIRAPLKAKVKNDTVGLGVHLREVKGAQIKKTVSLDAKQARRWAFESDKKRQMLREVFYENDDVLKHLGGG